MSAPTPPAPPTLPPYATYVEDRKPKFKTHTTLGNAHSAVVNHHPYSNVWVYQLGLDGWKVVEEYILPDNCTKCGGSFEYESYGRKYKSMYRSWGDRHLKEFEKPLICKQCRAKSVEEYNAQLREERERKQLASLREKYDI